jgi:hypothetical protein
MKRALISFPFVGLCLAGAGAVALDTSLLAEQSPSTAAVASPSGPSGPSGVPVGDQRGSLVEPENAPDAPKSDGPQFGRPNPGRPAYQDPELPAAEVVSSAAEPSKQKPSLIAAAGESSAAPLTLADGFFFDNVTNGTGFGVYGGEAVTSGQPQQLELPSAGLIARNLGLPIGPSQASSSTSPK